MVVEYVIRLDSVTQLDLLKSRFMKAVPDYMLGPYKLSEDNVGFSGNCCFRVGHACIVFHMLVLQLEYLLYKCNCIIDFI